MEKETVKCPKCGLEAKEYEFAKGKPEGTKYKKQELKYCCLNKDCNHSW